MTLRSRLPPVPLWLAVLGPLVAIAFAHGFYEYLTAEWPTLQTDPAFFQHTGWYILNGGVPYVDVWDVNPPVPFAVAAVLAALAGGDMLVLHALGSALTGLVAASSVLLVGWLAHRVTGEDAAAVAAGLSMLVVPELFLMSPWGIRAQFYALFFGVLALAFALRDRPLLAGAAAALSAGSWQSGLAFAPLVVGMAYTRTGGREALRAVAGGLAVAAVVALAFAAAGTDALVGMVVQTVVAPLVAGSSYTVPERVYGVLLVFGYGSLLLPLAFYGWVRAAVVDLAGRWWLPVGGAVLAFQVIFVDMDGSTDTFPWLAFVALGVAVTVERLLALEVPAGVRDRLAAGRGSVSGTVPADWRPLARQVAAVAVVVALVGVLVVSGLTWHHGSPDAQRTLQSLHDDAEADSETPAVTPSDGDVPSMQTIYWEKRRPDVCHYRLSWNEARWISMTDDHLEERTCGGWPGHIDRG